MAWLCLTGIGPCNEQHPRGAATPTWVTESRCDGPIIGVLVATRDPERPSDRTLSFTSPRDNICAQITSGQEGVHADETAASAGLVAIDDVAMLRPNDLDHRYHEYYRSVNLGAGNHILHVAIAGMPGTLIEVKLYAGVPAVPPSPSPPTRPLPTGSADDRCMPWGYTPGGGVCMPDVLFQAISARWNTDLERRCAACITDHECPFRWDSVWPNCSNLVGEHSLGPWQINFFIQSRYYTDGRPYIDSDPTTAISETNAMDPVLATEWSWNRYQNKVSRGLWGWGDWSTASLPACFSTCNLSGR